MIDKQLKLLIKITIDFFLKVQMKIKIKKYMKNVNFVDKDKEIDKGC